MAKFTPVVLFGFFLDQKETSKQLLLIFFGI